MRVRHRIPSIFNLSMVDVLCCALGCVILLWLVNSRAAKRQTDELSENRQALDRARSELTTTNEQLETARSRLVYLATTEQERDETKKRLAAAHVDLAALRRQIETLQGQLATAKDDAESVRGQLARAQSEARSTATQRDAARERLAEKEKAVLILNSDFKALKERADRLQEQADLVGILRDKLTEQEARTRQMEKEAAKRGGELDATRQEHREQLARTQAELDKARQEAEKTRKELQAANQAVEQLQGDKKVLRTEVDRVRAAVDNRFAGIQLTGKRVVFLVDMSGSMELVDEHTTAPSKWRGVREAVAKIMGSLPELEKFQVIVFSDKVRYLLGNEDRWLDYDPKTSADRVLNALAAIKPDGGTDMHAGMEAAFRFRDRGLDTLYFLSDGLPNLGPGLTAEQSRLSELERGDILGKYIRRLLKTDWNRERPNWPRVRLNTIGFFYESPDVGAFLWALARENDGSFVGMSRP